VPDLHQRWDQHHFIKHNPAPEQRCKPKRNAKSKNQVTNTSNLEEKAQQATETKSEISLLLTLTIYGTKKTN
jgi:hypothetical protein